MLSPSVRSHGAAIDLQQVVPSSSPRSRWKRCCGDIDARPPVRGRAEKSKLHLNEGGIGPGMNAVNLYRLAL